MNTTLIALAIAFASVSANANEPASLETIQARVSSKLVVSCSDEKLPSYANVSALLDTNNATVLHAARESMRRSVQHFCTHGIDSIAFAAADRATSKQTPDQMLAAVVNVSP